MRVVYVCADPGVPVFGSKGSSVHVQSILRAFLRLSARVELLATRTGGHRPDALAAVRVHRLPSVLPGEPARYEKAALAANGALASILDGLGPYDLLYERCSLWSHAALDHAREAGVPSVLEVNAPLIDEQAARRGLFDRAAAKSLGNRQVRSASLLAAVSEPVAEHLRDWHPSAADRVRVVGNGVDPERFPLHPVCGHPTAGRPFTVGFVGALEPRRGLTLLVDAFGRLLDRLPDGARLLVVGDGPERPSLDRALTRAGLVTAATLAGAVPPDRIPGMLASMDVTVAPYQDATCCSTPLSVLESMAAGVPVVVSRVAGLDTVVRHRTTGVLVPPGDAGAIAGALVELALRPVWRRGIGQAARRRVLATHTWDEVLERSLMGVAAPPSAVGPA